MSRMKPAGSARPQGRTDSAPSTAGSPRVKDRWSTKRKAQRSATVAAPSGDRRNRAERRAEWNDTERPRTSPSRDDRPRTNTRDERPRTSSSRDDRPRTSSSRDDRPRTRDDRPRTTTRDDRPRTGSRDDRAEFDRPRSDRARNDRRQTNRDHTARFESQSRRDDRPRGARDDRSEKSFGASTRPSWERPSDDRRSNDRFTGDRRTTSRFTEDRRRDDRRRDERGGDSGGFSNRRNDDRRTDDRPSYDRPSYDRRSSDRPSYSERPARTERPFRDDRPARTERPARAERADWSDRTPPAQHNHEDAVHERYLPASTVVAADAESTSTFAELGLNPPLVEALTALGASSPFPIQAASIPDVMSGRNVLGRGRTGSGKTIAFGAPMVQRLAIDGQPGGKGKRPAYGRRPRGLILAPTRELAMQINRTMEALARSQRLFTCVVVGGVPQQRQVQNLRRGVDIVIGTPGRLEDLIEQGKLDLSEVEITVLDEADHMCDLGFLEPVQRLLSETRPDGQRLLYSATLDRAVETLVAEYLTDPSVHEVSGEDQSSGTIDHRLLLVEQREKMQVLRELAGAGQKTLIFARTKLYAESLAERLAESGLSVTSLHGDLTQAKRSKNLQLLTSGKVSVLVATDVAARGIHVDDIGLVIQADPPQDHKTYLHRSGRTGRAGRAGTVVTLASRQKRRAVEGLLRNAEITVTPTNARPGDQVLRDLSGA